MTTPTNPSSTDIVNEMIARLRVLQGTGEYVPLTRNVGAGSGLTGGGSLEGDVSLALSADTLALLDEVRTSEWLESGSTSVAPTASTVALRDSSGRLKAAPPAATNDVATMGHVSAATARTVRTVSGQPEIQIATGDLATHNQASEVPGVLYLLFE